MLVTSPLLWPSRVVLRAEAGHSEDYWGSLNEHQNRRRPSSGRWWALCPGGVGLSRHGDSLASILLISERLAENTLGKLTEREVHALALMIEATDEIQILMKRWLLLTRLATRQLELDPGPFPLDVLIGELRTAHPSLTISTEPPLPASFTSDRLRLFELIELMVEVGLGLDPEAELRVASSPAGYLSFVVMGRLSDEQMTRAFDPFGAGLNVARQDGGSGLELAIVHRLNRALDGRFELHNNPDGKVYFEARFPLSPA